MGHPTPEAAALAGDGVTPATSVLISRSCGNVAGVVLADPAWGWREFVWCIQINGDWEEGSSSSGHTLWTHLEGDEDAGFLASWGDLADEDAEAFAFQVTFLGRESTATVQNGHWLWIVDHVRRHEIDAPATFVAVFSPDHEGQDDG